MMEKQTGMLAGIDAIIFDMDGTLIDSMWVWEAVDLDFYKKYKLAKPPEEFYQKMEGMSYTETAQLFLDFFPTLTQSLEELKSEWTGMAFEKYTTEVTLKRGIRNFLEEQKMRGMKLGVATSNGTELVEATLEALDIRRYFDSIHTACEVEKGKPAPDIYLLVAEELGVKPERCLVFEDVPMGILAGKNAGMRTCAVDDEFSRTQDMKKRSLADYYIQDYDELRILVSEKSSCAV